MALFDVSKYEIPSYQDIDMATTRKNFEIFIRAYKNSREKVGQPIIPKVTQTFSLIPPSTVNQGAEAERILIQREDDIKEFQELHQLFAKGYSAVSHPFKLDVIERRRQIFVLRYLQGFAVSERLDLMPVGKDTVTDESREALIQFYYELRLIIRKKESSRNAPDITKE